MKFGMSNPRIYWHDTKPVPSVSTIMKMFKSGIPFEWPAKRAMEFVKLSGVSPEFNLDDICDEAVHDAARYMDECMALGTAVHETIEQYFKTGDKTPLPMECDEEVSNDFIYRKMLINVFKWLDKYHVVPILVEKAMTSVRYAGTIDLFCEIDSEAFETRRWCKKQGVDFPQPHRRVKMLGDWKVAASYYDDMPVKLAAYRRLLGDYGYDCEGMMIMRFSKDTGSLNVKDFTGEYDDSLTTFNLATELFHHNFKDFLESTEQEADRQRIAKIERKKQ